MDDLQFNFSVPKKGKKNVVATQKDTTGYKFVSNPTFTGKTIARKRPANLGKQINFQKSEDEPQKKVAKTTEKPIEKSDDLAKNLQDLSQNTGKFHDKNYQDLSDDIQLKQKPRTGGWISSLFKNNPGVVRLGQRAVKPLVTKVFSGNSFSELDIHPHSVANLQQNLKLTEMMTVQQNAIPIILQGRDVLLRSQTGSGKTLAYALPIIEGLQAIRPKINRSEGIRVLIVVPTRELAVQTYDLFLKLIKPFTWVVPGLLSGGQKRKAEKACLRKGISVLIGTPGRVNDHLRHTQSLNFAKTGCLILDEADRLLDMGYEKDVAAIVKAIEEHKKNATYDPMAVMKQTIKSNSASGNVNSEPEKECNEDTGQQSDLKHHLTEVFLSTERQTILLSATLTKAVENLAGMTLVDPVFVDTSEGRAVVADSLKPQLEIMANEILINKKDKKNVVKENVKAPVETKEPEPKENNDDKVDNRRGLKQFNGAKHPDLFASNSNDATSSKTDTAIVNNATEDDSDSDSDYEYFKEQKKLVKKDEDVDERNEEEAVTNSAGNVFAEALKTAINEDELVLPATVNQTFLVVPMKLRLVTLCSLIVEHCVMNKKGGKMIVFMATLEMVDYHAELIETVLTGDDGKRKKKDKSSKKKSSAEDDEDNSSSDSEFEADYQAPPEGGVLAVELDVFKLHGSMPHAQRMEVFKQFRKTKTGVLICTDVAARGIDVPRVDLVLQYCAPSSATDYVHRVGRTGRAAAVGAAVMFLLPSETDFVRYLEDKRIRLKQSDESKALEPLRDIAPGANNAARAAIAVQARLEHVAHSNKDWLARASRAYTSWVRFYSGYPREVREHLDARKLHLGHSAKAFALRDTPGALARRAKNDPNTNKEKPTNRLTVHEEEEKKRPGFSKVKVGSLAGRTPKSQSSMHSASEFASGLDPLPAKKKKKNK